MPNYNFRNVNTGVEWTDFMSMADKDKLLEQNKDIVQILTPIAFGDSIRLGMRKPDDGFRDLLRTVQSHHPRGKGINTF
jgi:hypothetical protein